MRDLQRKGVSMVELLLVIAIMGTVFAIGLPKFIGMADRSALTSARNQVMAALSTARTTAVRRATTATFNASGNEVWVTADSSGTEINVIAKISLSGAHKVSMSTSGNTSKIAYNMRGLSSNSAGRIYLTRGSKGDSVCVTALGGATKLSCL